MSQTYFAGMFRAANFAYGIIPSVGALRVDQNTQIPAGGTTITVPQAYFATDDAIQVNQPLAATASITIGSGASQETFTPSSVSYNGTFASVTYATGFTYAHGEGDILASGTIGLQEAINFANANGGGVVIVDNRWTQLGGTNAMIAAATLPSNGTVVIQDNRAGGGVSQSLTVNVTNAQVKTLFSVGTQLLPAPGAGNAWVIDSMTVENVYLTAAFAAGGAIQASYGTGVTTPATSTIAATFLTSLTANQMVTVAGAMASTLSSTVLNKAITLDAATADFTTGGGSLIVKLKYHLFTGF
jgi:hypothetical protein